MYVCREAARGVVVGKELDLNEAKTQRGESNFFTPFTYWYSRKGRYTRYSLV